MPAYEFKFTEEFLIEASRRKMSVNPQRRKVNWMRFAFVICGIFLVITGTSRGNSLEYSTGMVCIVFFGGVVRIGEYFLRRNWRKSPYCNDQVRLVLDSDGIHGVGGGSSSDVKWSMVTHAYRLPDGFIISQGPQLANWLPDRALVEGTPEETELLLREYGKNFT